MNQKVQTRENINYEITGLGMQLRYLRDALMCTFMDIPVNNFFELRGNLPVSMDDRMPFLERMADAVDVEFCKDAKSQIFNTNDKELAEKFCELDLVVWQLVMLGTRYEEEHPAIGYNYRMSNVCAGIGRGQMTVLDAHIAHHKHVQALYEELLKDVRGAYPQAA